MMKMLTSLGGGTGVTAAAAAGVVLVGAIAWYEFGDRPVETPAALVAPQDAPTPAPATADPTPSTAPTAESTPQTEPAQPTTETAEDVQPDVVPPTPAPSFDEVRREADGTTVIAGRAVPGAVVQILQDGVEIATATADGSGQFATLAFIAPDGKGHVLTLLQTWDEVETASVDQIILAPLSPPVAVAEATEAPQTPQATGASPTPEAEEMTQTTEVAETPVQPTAQDAPPATDTVDATETVTVAETGDAVETAQTEDAQDTALAPEASVTAENTADVVTAETVAEVPQAETPVVAEETPQTTAAEPVTPTVDVAEAEAVTEVQAESVTTETPGTQVATADADQPAADASEDAAPTETSGMTVTPLPDDAEDVAAAPAADPQTPAKVAVLKATETGVELLNPDAPEVMDNVAIDTISYSTSGDVQLSGRAQTDTRSVRVYLDNDSIVNLPVDAQGRWRGDLPNVDEGIYTLRVDEVDEDGSVTSRVETPFKREAPAVLAAAAAEQQGPIRAITVQKGATLWAIARDRYGSGDLYVRVFEANKDAIRDPDLIYPGQIFDLPD